MEGKEKLLTATTEGDGYCPMITMPMEECMRCHKSHSDYEDQLYDELETCRKSEILKGKSIHLQIVVTLIIVALEYVITKENYIGWGAMAVFSARELINHWVDAFKFKKASMFVLVVIETIACISALLVCCLNILFM